ncbi:MAG: hypothetical protein WCT16_01340 [Candidatus Buchananbacteria bacterium]
MGNPTNESSEKKSTLGQLLRINVKNSRRVREDKEQEERLKRMKPFIDWANDLIEKLPQTLMAAAEKEKTSCSFDFIDLNKLLKDEIDGLSSERHQPPRTQQIINLFKSAYLTQFAPFAGEIIEDFCVKNELRYESTIQEDTGLISVTIDWKE